MRLHNAEHKRNNNNEKNDNNDNNDSSVVKQHTWDYKRVVLYADQCLLTYVRTYVMPLSLFLLLTNYL